MTIFDFNTWYKQNSHNLSVLAFAKDRTPIQQYFVELADSIRYDYITLAQQRSPKRSGLSISESHEAAVIYCTDRINVMLAELENLIKEYGI